MVPTGQDPVISYKSTASLETYEAYLLEGGREVGLSLPLQ